MLDVLSEGILRTREVFGGEELVEFERPLERSAIRTSFNGFISIGDVVKTYQERFSLFLRPL